MGRNPWSAGLSRRRGEIITHEERRLLEEIGNNISSTMPPGTVPNPVKKKIRPTSASAKIQTYHGYTSGFYDDSRAEISIASNVQQPSGTAAGGLPQRPKTQAGGPRFWSRTVPKEEHEVKAQRRPTVSNVYGIADTVTRPLGLGGAAVGVKLQGKVHIEYYSARHITNTIFFDAAHGTFSFGNILRLPVMRGDFYWEFYDNDYSIFIASMRAMLEVSPGESKAFR